MARPSVFVARRAEELGELYESKLGGRRVRRVGGAYYTPAPLVEHVLDETLRAAMVERQRRSLPTVLDPACGAGAFLVKAYRRLLEEYARRQPLRPADRKRILLNCIHGVDIDPGAVEVTRRSLRLVLAEDGGAGRGRLPDLSRNIRCGDALLGIEWAREFDVVIGNPPWGQKGIGRDDKRIQRLRERFESLGGIFDLFRPFVELGIRLTRVGGRFGMVLPDIVLLKNYEATRRHMLDKLTLTAIDWWGMAFDGAVIDAATICGVKECAPVGHRVKVAIRDPADPLAHEIPQADFVRNPRCTFNLRLTADRRAVLDRLADRPRIGDFFEIHEGVHSGNIRSELFVDRRVDASCRKLLFGRGEIEPYRLRWAGRYVRLSAAPRTRSRGRYANVGRPEWFAGDKVLVRRTGDRIVAAVDEEGRYASNNFFVVFPKAGHPLDLHGLCALLNSPFLTWYFRTIEPRRGRVFAELKIKHLRALPLPRPVEDAAICRRLNRLGRRRARNGGGEEAIASAVCEVFGWAPTGPASVAVAARIGVGRTGGRPAARIRVRRQRAASGMSDANVFAVEKRGGRS